MVNPPEKPDEQEYRILIYGSPKVGKSTLLHQFTTGKAPTEDFEPLTSHCHITRSYKNKQYRMFLMDMNKDESVLKADRGKAHGFVLVFSMDSHESFDEMMKFIGEEKRKTLDDRDHDQDSAKVTPLPIVLVANKCDLPNRELDIEYVSTEAKKNGVIFVRSSSKFPLHPEVIDGFYKLIDVIKAADKVKPTCQCACSIQ